MARPSDYVMLSFKLNKKQYQAALRKLQSTQQEENEFDITDHYFAGNITGYHSLNDGRWHYSALVGDEIVMYGSYRELFDNGHFATLREILGEIETIRECFDRLNLLSTSTGQTT